MRQAEILQQVKTFLPNVDQDELLKVIISQTMKALSFKLKLRSDETIPDELEYIVIEVTIKRFNRIGNEGMQSYSQEGESITFNGNDFDDFKDDIAQWLEDNGKNVKSLGTLQIINPYEG